MSEPPLTGVIPILQTPFLKDDSLDLLSLTRQVEYVGEAGCRWVAFPGFVSEWWKLDAAEIEQCAQAILRAAGDDVAVLLNVTAQSTRGACEQARKFRDLGARALMCLPPFVVPRSASVVADHLGAVLDATRLPFLLQLSPTLTGTQFSPAQVRALPRLAGVKVDFVPPGPMISELREALGPACPLLIGFAGLQMVDAIARGATGLMGGAGHVREDRATWEALLHDPGGVGSEAFAQLLPLLNSEMQTIDLSIATHKWLLAQAGVLRTDRVRAPGPHLDSFQVKELEANIARAQRVLPGL